MSEKDKKGEKGRTITEWVCIIAAILCLAGVIYCCYSFINTSHSFSAEYEKVLAEISASASLKTISDNLPGTSSVASPGDENNDSTDPVGPLISHMENIISIQKTGMTNDLMSFIYGILSTTLVGLCATFVTKSSTNADEAKKTVDEANKAIDKAKTEVANATKKAKYQADLAGKKARQTEAAIKDAEKATEMAKRIQYRLNLSLISNRIVTVRFALADLDYILANGEIYKIYKEIDSIFNNNDFLRTKKSKDFEDREIEILDAQLMDLDESVNKFLSSCEERYNNDPNALKVRKDASENYHKWIQTSLRIMNRT